jgi:hypothetical protein
LLARLHHRGDDMTRGAANAMTHPRQHRAATQATLSATAANVDPQQVSSGTVRVGLIEARSAV